MKQELSFPLILLESSCARVNQGHLVLRWIFLIVNKIIVSNSNSFVHNL